MIRDDVTLQARKTWLTPLSIRIEYTTAPRQSAMLTAESVTYVCYAKEEGIIRCGRPRTSIQNMAKNEDGGEVERAAGSQEQSAKARQCTVSDP